MAEYKPNALMLVPLFGIFRALPVYLAPGPSVAAISFVFNTLWFGVLWAAVTPYRKGIVAKESNVFAQGVWNVVSMGVGSFLGSFVSGRLAENLGVRDLFLVLTVLCVVITVATPFLVSKEKTPSEA